MIRNSYVVRVFAMVILSIGLFVGARLSASGQTAVLVKDIWPGPSPADSVQSNSPMANMNGTLIFAANDGVHGMELWKSDGTAAGTVMVKDVETRSTTPGTTLGSSPANFAVLNPTTVLFTATGVPCGSGRCLWRTDGTDIGTVMIKTVDPSGAAYPIVVMNGVAFFSAVDPTPVGFGSPHGALWRSDGTDVGTMPIRDEDPTSTLTVVNNALYFTADECACGFSLGNDELWTSDGTAAGTGLAQPVIRPGQLGSHPQQLTNVSGTLFFLATDGISPPAQLWKVDPFLGPVLVKSLGAAGYQGPQRLTNVNGTLFFLSASTTGAGWALWKSDGFPAGTTIVMGGWDNMPDQLTNVNGRLFFNLVDAIGGALWMSDGTTAGTAPVLRGIQALGRPVAVGDTLYFAANGGSGDALWQSDGTLAGTVQVSPVAPDQFTLTDVNGTLFFSGWEAIHGQELWKLGPPPPPGTPSAPTSVAAVAADSQVSLTWLVPSSDGGSAITGYNVYRSQTPGVQGSYVGSPAGTATAFLDTGLTNGITDYYMVTAVNAVGEGAASTQVSATPNPVAATITSFAPAGAPVGAQVVITGAHLIGTVSVAFNGVPSAFNVDSDTQITATVPAAATTGLISVTKATPPDPCFSAVNFLVAPAITGFSPGSGPAGTLVTITGTTLTGTTAVAFNGHAAAFSVMSATQVQATVPTGATSGAITVTTPSGTGSSATIFSFTLPVPVLAYTGQTTTKPNASVTLSATLKTSGNVALVGKTVTFTLNGANFPATTNSLGVASTTTVAPSTDGPYPIGVAFAGDATYGPVSIAPTLTVARTAVTLAYTSPTSAVPGAAITLTATLKLGSTALSSKTVTFTLNGVSINKVTTSSGATWATTAPAVEGPYTVGIAFAGDATYAPASISPTLTVARLPTTLSYTGPASVAPGAVITLKATLKSGTTSLSSKTVTFTLNGVSTNKVTSSGVATFATTAPQVQGSFPIGIAFAGDTTYAPTSISPAPSLLVTSLPDLVETALTLGATSATHGGTLKVTDSVVNQGPVAAGASTTRYYLSVDQLGLAGGNILLSPSRSVAALAVAAKSSATVTVTIPAATPLGVWYVRACADDLHAVSENNETNNCVASATQILIK